MNNPCSILNGGCEDICRLDIKGEVECSCYRNRVPVIESNKRCVEITSIPGRNCSTNEFKCSSLECIPFENTCDGRPHCQDKSDEDVNYCGLYRIISKYFSLLFFR